MKTVELTPSQCADMRLGLMMLAQMCLQNPESAHFSKMAEELAGLHMLLRQAEKIKLVVKPLEAKTDEHA